MTYIDFINQCKSDNHNLVFEGLHSHHIIPKSEGGTDSTDNLVQLTPAQHFWVHVLYDREHETITSRIFRNFSHIDPQCYEDCLPYNKISDRLRKNNSERMKGMCGESSPSFGILRSEELKKQISEKLKGKHNSPSTEFKKGNIPWSAEKHHSEETKEKIRQSHLGKKQTEESKEKKRQALKNRSDVSKKVQQFTLDGHFVAEYPSTCEASRQTNIYQSSISLCCQGKRKSAGGYIWRFA